MRIKAIYAKEIQPIKLLHVDDLSDVVVFAGPNGVGKTRFVDWLLNFIRSLPINQDQWIQVEATSQEEREEWGQTLLDTRKADESHKLRQTLQKSRPRGRQEGSVLHFESDRSIVQIQPYNFSWDFADPFTEMVGWDTGFTRLAGRFQDTVHSIFRNVRSRREAIALQVEQLIEQHQRAQREETAKKAAATESVAMEPTATESPGKGAEANDKHLVAINPNDFPDPLIPFSSAFSQLLAPKVLVPPDPKKQQLFYRDGEEERPITALSSGEREVVNIVFDFLLRSPSDCVVVFDEPELHLHPELSYKLIQTLRNVGVRNQFIFCTHSAEIISASLDNSVIFVSPPRADGGNQAISVQENDDTHRALRLLGQSIGIVSLGRKIVLIEGEHGSLDKQTYGAILKGRYPNLALVPSGGKGLIQSFSALQEHVLDKSIWGVDFFMLCDQDAIPGTKDAAMLEGTSGGRFRMLKRYHLENYFLDENIISEVFAPFESQDSWLRSPSKISDRLKQIAREFLSYSSALSASAFFREKVGNLDIMPKACHAKSAAELSALMVAAAGTEATRINSAIQASEIEKHILETMQLLENSLANSGDDWKCRVPGRVILQVFCSKSHANLPFGRFKIAYLKAAANHASSPFKEIEDMFDAFSNFPSEDRRGFSSAKTVAP